MASRVTQLLARSVVISVDPILFDFEVDRLSVGPERQGLT